MGSSLSSGCDSRHENGEDEDEEAPCTWHLTDVPDRIVVAGALPQYGRPIVPATAPARVSGRDGSHRGTPYGDAWRNPEKQLRSANNAVGLWVCGIFAGSGIRLNATTVRCTVHQGSGAFFPSDVIIVDQAGTTQCLTWRTFDNQDLCELRTTRSQLVHKVKIVSATSSVTAVLATCDGCNVDVKLMTIPRISHGTPFHVMAAVEASPGDSGGGYLDGTGALIAIHSGAERVSGGTTGGAEGGLAFAGKWSKWHDGPITSEGLEWTWTATIPHLPRVNLFSTGEFRKRWKGRPGPKREAKRYVCAHCPRPPFRRAHCTGAMLSGSHVNLQLNLSYFRNICRYFRENLPHLSKGSHMPTPRHEYPGSFHYDVKSGTDYMQIEIQVDGESAENQLANVIIPMDEYNMGCGHFNTRKPGTTNEMDTTRSRTICRRIRYALLWSMWWKETIVFDSRTLASFFAAEKARKAKNIRRSTVV